MYNINIQVHVHNNCMTSCNSLTDKTLILPAIAYTESLSHRAEESHLVVSEGTVKRIQKSKNDYNLFIILNGSYCIFSCFIQVSVFYFQTNSVLSIIV